MLFTPDGEPTERQRKFIEACQKIEDHGRKWIEADRERSRKLQQRRSRKAQKPSGVTPSPTGEE